MATEMAKPIESATKTGAQQIPKIPNPEKEFKLDPPKSSFKVKTKSLCKT